MKKLLLSLMLISVVSILKSQDYNLGLGVRLGSSNGLSVKWLYANTETKYYGLEGSLSSRNGGFVATGMWEFQKEIHLRRGGSRYSALYWYIGPGMHLGSYEQLGDSQVKIITFGVDATVGLEYVFADFPVTLSLDARPFYQFLNIDKFEKIEPYDIGFSIRYAFKSY